MSELQMALLGAGLAAVAAVWAYNFWQERKHKKLAENIFNAGQPDVLLNRQGGADGDERVEPVAFADDRIEPVAAFESSAPAECDLSSPGAVPPAWLDEIAECLLRLDFAEPVAAPALWAAQAEWAERVSKPMTWLGWDGSWRRLTAHDAGAYRHLAVAVQLADRQGAASAEELQVFLEGVDDLAQRHGAHVERPTPQQLATHAQALDTFCAGVDVQLSVNVVAAAGASFSGTKLRGLTEAMGLTLREDGQFHAEDEESRSLFAVANMGPALFDAETLRTQTCTGMVFTLDVPRVEGGTAVFTRMVTVARQMADGLGGVLVNGQGQPLSDAMVDGIRAKIAELQQRMAAHEIPAGSPRALRLFS